MSEHTVLCGCVWVSVFRFPALLSVPQGQLAPLSRASRSSGNRECVCQAALWQRHGLFIILV